LSKKSAVVGMRLTAAELAALERACTADESRPPTPPSVLSRFVLTQWLAEQGYLAPAEAAP
jgi:hypothetical protein